MGCFWFNNPADGIVPEGGTIGKYQCADCNYLDCSEIGGMWLPIPCETLSHLPGASTVYEIIECPIDGSGGVDIGYCCIQGNDGCEPFGPITNWDGWCDTMGGNWISLKDWRGGAGMGSPQAWASKECNKLCGKEILESTEADQEKLQQRFVSDMHKFLEMNANKYIPFAKIAKVPGIVELVINKKEEEPIRTAFNGPWKMRDTDNTIKQYYKDDIVTWAGKTYKVIADVKAKHPSNTPSSFLLIEDKNAQVDGGLF